MPGASPVSLSDAIAHHQRGELQQAVQMYQQILALEPNNADALHLLGVAALQCGQPQQAVQLIERAVTLTPDSAVFHGNLGEAYRACGDTQHAAASYQASLNLQPAAADVATNFAALLLQAGRPADAAELCRYAIQYQPDFALAHNNLGSAYRQLGDLHRAHAHFQRAVELAANLAIAQTNLGQLLVDCGRPREALPYCENAVRLEPSAASYNNLGNAYRKLDQLESARDCYSKALQLAPKMATIHDNLGQVAYEEMRFDEAAREFQTAVQLAPTSMLYHRHAGEALTGLQRFDEAEKHLRIAENLEPGAPHIRYSIGWLYYEQGRLEEAEAQYRSILEEYPTHPIVNQHLGEVLIELNRIEEALACFRTALRDTPTYSPALAKLAEILRGQLPAEERSALVQRLEDPNLADSDRAPLLFSLAQVCDADAAYDEAAEHLDSANRLELALRKKRGQTYNIKAHRRFVDRLMSLFTPSFFERTRGFGVESERPIFIFGLPRSGTTLVEQILSSHSRVFGAGELMLSRKGFEKLGGGSDGLAEMRSFDALESIDATAVRGLAEAHLEGLQAVNGTADRVCDKMPDNYLYLGYLALLFPKARFLHCRRDPRDVAVSCWITQFRLVPWANHPEHLASRFAQYQRVMQHWQQVLPVPVLDIDYEDVVHNLEAAAQRILDFCDLPWESACRDFHHNRRAIRTASALQVRQPVYQRAVARWRNYEKALQPLFRHLERAFDLPEQDVPEDIAALAAEGR